MEPEVEDADIEVRENSKPQKPSMTLFNTSDPEKVINKAESYANPLAEKVQNQGLISEIQGNDHVEIEGWTMLGSMLGVFPVTEWTEYVEYGDVKGFECAVKAVTRQGEIVGRAEAMCTDDERNWEDATLQELRSMAQTRASSKALRMPLGFIIELAGFQATPAEEMSGVKNRSGGSNGSGGNDNDFSTDPHEVQAPPFMDGVSDGDVIADVNEGGLEFLHDEYLTGDKLDGDYAEQNRAMKKAVKKALNGDVSDDDSGSDENTENSSTQNKKKKYKKAIQNLATDLDWSVVDVEDDGWLDVVRYTAEEYSEGESDPQVEIYRDIYEYLKSVNEGEQDLELDEGLLPIIPF